MRAWATSQPTGGPLSRPIHEGLYRDRTRRPPRPLPALQGERVRGDRHRPPLRDARTARRLPAAVRGRWALGPAGRDVHRVGHPGRGGAAAVRVPRAGVTGGQSPAVSVGPPAIVNCAFNTSASTRGVRRRTAPSLYAKFAPSGWFPPNCPPGPIYGLAPGASSSPRTVALPPRSHGPGSSPVSPNRRVWLNPSAPAIRSSGV